MKTVTIEEFVKFDPCYTEDQLKAIAGDKKEWSALDILNLDKVPATDKLWAVLREELIDARILHEFACVCAEQALTTIDNPDQRSIDAIKAKRAWLCGEITDEELASARDAACSAARDAARAARAARDAARDAACSAARDAARAARAARDAAWASARDAARDAAWDAAWAVASADQVEMLVEILRRAA